MAGRKVKAKHHNDVDPLYLRVSAVYLSLGLPHDSPRMARRPPRAG